jgi:hypothetical protein
MAHLSGVSRRPASLPRVQGSSGIVSRGAGVEVTVRVQAPDPATRWSGSQVMSKSPGYPTKYLLLLRFSMRHEASRPYHTSYVGSLIDVLCI